MGRIVEIALSAGSRSHIFGPGLELYHKTFDL